MKKESKGKLSVVMMVRQRPKKKKLLDRIAEIEETHPTTKAREYVEAGIDKDVKKYNIKEDKN